MSSQIQSSLRAFINGELVQSDKMAANYDGKHLLIDINKNGQQFSKMLNNKDIERILTKPAHKLSLEHRLHKDFFGKRKQKNRPTKKRKYRKKGKKSIKKKF